MPDGVNIPGGPSFIGTPQPPDVPCDPTGEAWRGPPGPQGLPGLNASSGITVRDYGAVGDGVTNDAPAFAAALAAVAAGGTVVVPAGTYAIGAALSQAITAGVTLEGAGSGTTVLNFASGVNGIAFSLSPAAVVHVHGLSIIRPPGTVYTNTGLSITTPLAHASRQGLISIRDVVLIGAWQTGVNIYNCDFVSLDHVYVTGANADGSGAGVGIACAGMDASHYLVELAVNDCTTIGCSIGLQVGDWIQGVYVTNSRFIGNDYGIRWSGTPGHADLWLAVSNTHFNSSTRGIFAAAASSPQIVNTYTLRFGSPSLDGQWIAFDLGALDSGLLSGNNIYGTGTTFTGTEHGFLISNSSECIIVGNHLHNFSRGAGIYLNNTHNTLIAGNIGSIFGSGIPLIQASSAVASNQALGNQTNGVPDLAIDTSGVLQVSAGLQVAGNINATGSVTAPAGFVCPAGLFLIGAGYYLQRSTSLGDWTFVEGGTTNLTIKAGGDVLVRGNLTSGASVTGVTFWSGANQVLGPRITGWGTSTGGVRGAITASSTLPQVAAALAQLLTDLSTHGLIRT